MKASIPTATVSRLPVYLRCLSSVPFGRVTCSSSELAEIAGVNSAQVRKDLSFLGTRGVRGVGYNINELRLAIARALGLTHDYAVAIIGAGNLGRALANYPGFSDWGFEVAAVLDRDPAKLGIVVAGLRVEPMSDLEEIITRRDVTIAIVATPASVAQEVATRLEEAGIRSILNFAPTVLQIGDDVSVRRVDLSTELQILTYHQQVQNEARERKAGSSGLGT
jgi:redox-sensing transcriptional repressor